MSLANLIGVSSITCEESWMPVEDAVDQSSLDQYDDNSLICCGHHGQMLPISG